MAADDLDDAPHEPSLDDLIDVVRRFCERRNPFRSGEQLARDLPRLRHAMDLLELHFAKDAAAFSHTDEADLQGSSTPIDWIRHNCRMSGHAAADRVRVGRQLHRLPDSARATGEGRIGYAHLSLIASTARAITDPDPTRPFDERPLLEGALEQSVGRFRYLCHHLRHAQDQEGLAAEQRAAHEARRLELTPCEDGSLAVRGLLDSAGGAALRTALEPLARRRGRDDDRLRPRRLADALVELATHALDTGRVPRQGSQRPHLQVTTTLETLLGMAGAPAAEMEYSLPISARTVERIACDCTVTRVLLGADSAVIDVGRSRRLVSGSLRKALNVRDRHCQWPGCDRPASWCQSHHLLHWLRGGATTMENTTLLCSAHHWRVHEGGWQLLRTDDGRLITIPPSILHPRSRGPGIAAAA